MNRPGLGCCGAGGWRLVVDIGGRDVNRAGLKDRETIATHGVASDLNQKSLQGLRVVLFGCLRISSCKAVPNGHAGAVGAFGGHGIEGIGECDDAHGTEAFRLPWRPSG